MTRWVDNRLDLGALGVLRLEKGPFVGTWQWTWEANPDGAWRKTESAARRAALAWLRRALKRAANRG